MREITTASLTARYPWYSALRDRFAANLAEIADAEVTHSRLCADCGFIAATIQGLSSHQLANNHGPKKSAGTAA